jgi:hypothetical protein
VSASEVVFFLACFAGPTAIDGSLTPLSLGTSEAPVIDFARRTGHVRVVGHSLVDDGGPFLGLGVSYFTALWRCKYDRPRLEKDLEFLSEQGFTSYRMLSMVGHNVSWQGLEIAPVPFTTRDGRRIEAWPDYWDQLRELIDIAHDKYGLRTQITIFADAQLMPTAEERAAHLRRVVEEVVRGREQKIILLEVANEAWQNGFPGDEGVVQLRSFARDLDRATDVPIAITSNHGGPGDEAGEFEAFERIYRDSAVDLATWHFSRDLRVDDGWKPVFDCWNFAERPHCPPVISNEPIGPGSSVNAEREPIRLVMAAAFAFAAKLPMYVFHSQAGVHGKTRFEDTPSIDQFREFVRLLPADLPNWERSDGRDEDDPFLVLPDGNRDRFVLDASSTGGCVRIAISSQGDRFVALPIGILSGGLEIEAKRPIEWTAFNPVTGKELKSARLSPGERASLPAGPGALVVRGRVRAD